MSLPAFSYRTVNKWNSFKTLHRTNLFLQNENEVYILFIIFKLNEIVNGLRYPIFYLKSNNWILSNLILETLCILLYCCESIWYKNCVCSFIHLPQNFITDNWKSTSKYICLFLEDHISVSFQLLSVLIQYEFHQKLLICVIF